jgi:hypothetical protein
VSDQGFGITYGTYKALKDEIAAKDAELARLRGVVEAARDISECPITPDTATYNQGKGIDSAPPHQAVVMVHCSWTRWKALTASLRALPSPAEAVNGSKHHACDLLPLLDSDRAEAGENCAECLTIVAKLAKYESAPAEAGEKPTEWRPMESAPKNGTEVLLAVRIRAVVAGKMLVGHFMPGGHCIEDHPAIEAGWYFWNGSMFDEASEPVAWMPLPAAPSDAKAGERPCRCGHDRAEHFETGNRLSCRPDGDARNCPCDGFSPAAKPETKEK